MIYQYEYITESLFVPAVQWHFFKLRAIPCDNEFQRVEGGTLRVTPACLLFHSKDGQGNDVQWGSFGYMHDTFKVESAGTVIQRQPYALHETPAPYYLTATRLTQCTEAMLELLEQFSDKTCFGLSLAIMHKVHNHIVYAPGHTTVATTAEEVFTGRQGVCQDYAHLMIALCRAAGLHARYVNGFIAGEGQTHAWVEVSDGKVWLPFDPTHDLEPEWGYVKIAHGRDADDCPTNRGRIYGCTNESQFVIAKIK